MMFVLPGAGIIETLRPFQVGRRKASRILQGSRNMFHRVWEKGKQELHAGKKWVKQPSNRLRLLVMGVILAGLICAAVWVNRPLEGEAPTSAMLMSQNSG